MRFLIGLLLGLAIWPVGIWLYLRSGHPPVAVADKAFPYEAQIVHIPLERRIEREMPASVPIQPTPDNLQAGAQVYFMNCAGCHGTPDNPAEIADHLYPSAPQLWQRHHNGQVVGVSDDPPGETYWKVTNGIRLTGMPSFEKLLSPTQMWQVSVLLANADKSLPPAVLETLNKK